MGDDDVLKNTLPVLLLKNLILLPNQDVKLELNTDLSRDVVFLANESYHNELIVMSLKDQKEELPDVSDLPSIAIVAKIKSKILLPNGNLRVTLRGLFRAEVGKLLNNKENENILECSFLKMDIPKYDEVEALAVKRKLEELVNIYVNSVGVSNSILNLIKDLKDLNKLTDVVASFLPLSFSRKLEYIEEMNPVFRANRLLEDLHLELEIIKLDQKLEESLQLSLEESQKEFLLKEKLKEIEKELGIADSKEKEVLYYEKKLEKSNIENPKIVVKIKSEIKKLKRMGETSPEVSNVRNYLDWMFSLPWNQYSKDEKNFDSVKKSLDKSHFGMNEAKMKVVEYVAAKNHSQSISTPVLCLIGPPGCGKTTFAKSIADSLHKSFFKMSVGGLNDSAILNGHRRTYLGASPGKIIEGLKKCGTKNPVFLIDEVDKMVKDYKGDPASVLLDILDESQNKTFVDNYIEEEFDLSSILFILTANRKEDIPYELKDRLEIIELSSYTVLEKMSIAKKYLIPNILEEHNLSSKNIKFLDSSLKEIILNYTKEAGVRDLKRILVRILRKLIVENHYENVKITNDNLFSFLGANKYESGGVLEKNLPGIVNALAVYSNGGEVIPIETCCYHGTGKIKITGQVEKIMGESIEVSLSYILNNKEKFDLHIENFQTKDLHIHFLNASVKKEGPSAGITITTALLSLLKNKKISSTISMTGEMTLNGFVRKVGGLKEKLIGASNAGMKVVFIPKENHNDLKDVPVEVFEKLEIIEITNYEELYKWVFKEKN